MCGIVGFIDPSCESRSERLDLMEKGIFSRGPDGAGHFFDGPLAMGMRRLAIIDLIAGDQPLMSLNGNIAAFQNGEIYNFHDLRTSLEKEGFVFLTKTDTEVLAHGYAQWGMEGLLSRVDGMYAMAIFDKRSNDLYIARDRFGEKPLFYTFDNRRFAYASDLRMLVGLPWVSDDFDPLSLNRYLALHYAPGERTIFSGIRRLLPGYYMKVRISKPEPILKCYYRPALKYPAEVKDEQLMETLESSVSSRLVSDVPVGVFLSGGLDSSIVATIAAKHSPSISTFSIGFVSDRHDETKYAKELARHIGSKHHHFLFDESSFNDLLPLVARSLDEPIGDQATLPLYWLCREARKHVTVVLSGEGADEVFCGYDYYEPFSQDRKYVSRIISRLKGRTSPEPFRRLIDNPKPITPSGFPLLTDVRGRSVLLPDFCPWTDTWESDLLDWLDGAHDPLQHATAADLTTWLPDDLLVKFDRMTMANSLEGRAPFLQPELVAIGLSGLTPSDRMSGGISKVALRRVAKSWLPENIQTRKKQGFVLPMTHWIKAWFVLKGGVKNYFNAQPIPLVDQNELIRLVQHDLELGLQRGRLIFSLILLSEWYCAFTDQVSDFRAKCQ